MNPIYRGPFGPLGSIRAGVEVPPRRDDEHPRSLPEDRSEGNLNPDPVVECRDDCPPTGRAPGEPRPAGYHHPSGEPDDDDGAGNPSPREVEELHYGLEDADGPDWSEHGRRAGPED